MFSTDQFFFLNKFQVEESAIINRPIAFIIP